MRLGWVLENHSDHSAAIITESCEDSWRLVKIEPEVQAMESKGVAKVLPYSSASAPAFAWHLICLVYDTMNSNLC